MNVLQRQKNLYETIAAVQRFAPKPIREPINHLLRELFRLGANAEVNLDPDKGEHKVTVTVFPEQSDESLWHEIVYAFSFNLESVTAVIIPKLQIEARVRRTAVAYSLWLQRNKLTLDSVAEELINAHTESGTSDEGDGDGDDKLKAGDLRNDELLLN